MSLVGRANRRRARRGVTLMEMLIVVALIGLMVGISFPSISSGIDSLRMSSAAGSVVTFLNVALNYADRRQDAVEIVVSREANMLGAGSVEPGFRRRLDLPSGIRIEEVLPRIPSLAEPERRFLLLPGGTIPGIGIVLADRRGDRRIVRVDPMTGAPVVELPDQAQP